MGELYDTKADCLVPQDSSQNFISFDLQTATNILYPPMCKLKDTIRHKTSETLFRFSIAFDHL